MNAHLIDVSLSFLPYLIIGAFFLLFGALLEPLAHYGCSAKKPDKTDSRKIRSFLFAIAFVIWAFGLFIALRSPSNLPKHQVFDKTASHREIVEAVESNRKKPKAIVKDETLKPELLSEREERFKSLTD